MTVIPPDMPIKFELDIPYAESDIDQQQLDLIRPARSDKTSLPLIIFLHSGAWEYGDKGDGRPYLGTLVRTLPCVVAAVNYRFISQAPWPAQLHDCKAAIRWLRAHAAQYNVNPDKVAVWGDGAGAHLALMLAATSDNHAFSGCVGPYHNQSTKIQAVINYAGVVDLPALTSQVNEIGLQAQQFRAALSGVIPEELINTISDASPLHFLNGCMPPVLSFHSQQDEIIPPAQSDLLHERLTELGVVNNLIRLMEGKHGQFPQETLETVLSFLKRTFNDIP